MSLSPKNHNHSLVWAEIDLGALRHNLREVRRHIGPKTGVLAIVKADAYGHGMVRVAKALEKDGVRFFGVANIAEAMELRKACPRADILVLGCPHPKQVPLYLQHRIIPTVSCWEDARIFDHIAKKRIPVHVKVDTGMGRLGIWHEEAWELFEKLRGLKNISIEGVYTHFANADHPEKVRTERQMEHFQYLLEVLKKHKALPRYIHAANSMGLARFKKSHLTLVRPGIVLYGINPFGGSLPLKLKPVMTLKTRVALIKKVGKGRPVSYGSTYHAPRETFIAVLPIGYSHGYKVGYSNKASVEIRGRRYPVVGRVTMDQTLVDLGDRSPVRRWDEVFILGQKVTAQELASYVGTIPYEVLCSVHTRIPRF
jgi:alanine racemase